MRGHRLTGPHGADFFGGVVTDREDEIERGGIGACKLLPALAAQALRGEMSGFQLLERRWVHSSCGMAACAVRFKVGAPLWLRMASAMMERAEFPVHRNRTL